MVTPQSRSPMWGAAMQSLELALLPSTVGAPRKLQSAVRAKNSYMGTPACNCVVPLPMDYKKYLCRWMILTEKAILVVLVLVFWLRVTPTSILEATQSRGPIHTLSIKRSPHSPYPYLGAARMTPSPLHLLFRGCRISFLCQDTHLHL